MAMLLCMLFMVIASAESYTVEYYVKDSKKTEEKTDENGQITLRADKYSNDTKVYEITDANGNKVSATREFFGWFDESGVCYKPGETITVTQNLKLRESYGLTVYTIEDLKALSSDGDKKWIVVRLGTDIVGEGRTDSFGAIWGVTIIDMNGHNLTWSTSHERGFGSQGTGIIFIGKGTYTYEHTGTNAAAKSRSAAVYIQERWGDGEKRLWIGKDVTIKSNTNILRGSNNGTANLPVIKIYGTVEAGACFMTYSGHMPQIPFTIYPSANITVKGSNFSLESATDGTLFQIHYSIEGGKFTLDSSASSMEYWADSITKHRFNITGGSYNVKLPSEILNNGYECVYNEATGYYDVMYVACDLEGSNGTHSFAISDAYQGATATCEEAGTYYFRCGCGSFCISIVDPLGHDYSKIEIVTVATPTSAGLKRYTCVREGCSVDDAGNPASYDESYTVDVDTSETETTITVMTSDGTTKEITLKVSDAFNMTTSGTTITFNGVKNITIETEKYTKANIVRLTIPTGVTNVATNAFNGYTVLEEVLTADGTAITFASGAFKDCPAFTKLTFGDGNYTFQSKTFSTGCGTSAIIDARKANVTFSASSFESNTCITEVLMSAGHTYTFGSKAFYGSALKEIVFPDNSTIVFPNSTKTYIFQSSTSLEYIYLGSNIGFTEIKAERADFDGLISLSKLVIMDITYIGKWNFSLGDKVARTTQLHVYCHSQSITIENEAFNTKGGGEEIHFYTSIKNFESIGGNCNYVIYRGIPHKYVAQDSAPTCTLPGSTGYSTDCPCGVVANATYTVVAYPNYTGDTAGGTITIDGTTPANGHTFDPEKSEVVGQTSAKCGEKATIIYKCLYCDETSAVEVGEVQPHVLGEWIVTLKETCTTDGLRQQSCTKCGAIAEVEKIPATGHLASGEWVILVELSCTVGETRVQYCNNDGCDCVVLSETGEPSGHNPSDEWTVTLSASCERAGEMKKHCTTCRAAIETVAIDALGHEFDVADGAVVNKITYANGFDKKGIAFTKCVRCDETNEGECAPIFTAKGYSVNSEGSSLNGGYTVDLALLNSYIATNGNVEFGIVIANANSFTGNFFENGKVTSAKALQVGITPEYSNFDCSIYFNGANNASSTLELIITAYVIDEEGNVSFVQVENDYALSTQIGEDTFTSVTLDRVKANVIAQQPDAILPSNDEE